MNTTIHYLGGPVWIYRKHSSNNDNNTYSLYNISTDIPVYISSNFSCTFINIFVRVSRHMMCFRLYLLPLVAIFLLYLVVFYLSGSRKNSIYTIPFMYLYILYIRLKYLFKYSKNGILSCYVYI